MLASFNKLVMLVEDVIQQSPLNGHLFVFRNRQNDKIKILWWDHNGFWITYRRIEKGRFKIPKVGELYMEISYTDLVLLLAGIDISKRRRFPRLHYNSFV